MQIQEILKKTYPKINSSLDAEILLAKILKKSREFILSHGEKKITSKKIADYKKLINKRIKNIPLAYLLGEKEFYGLNFLVNKNVLIPRPETEILVEQALEIVLNNTNKNNYIIDIGTGSGCIIITFIKELQKKISYQKLQKYSFFASDISKKALQVARQNTRQHKLQKKINFLQGSLLEPFLEKQNTKKNKLTKSQNILILANLPYLTPQQVKDSPTIQAEPELALVAGKDGLKYYQQLFKEIKKLKKLNFSYQMICEIDPAQVSFLKKIVKQELGKNIKIIKDLRKKNRFVYVG